MSDKIEVVELFAGVGGFRLGLEGFNGKSASSGYKQDLVSRYEVVWSNQWEPGASRQTASDIYKYHWGSLGHYNDNIHQIAMSESLGIPPHDLLVGGFPCQDYSVANTLRNAGGIKGKKGVLWWDIHRLLERLYVDEDTPTKYLMLENVDRLLNSPVKQRGRDFAIMLGSLADLGYIIEWRVINAADYVMPQRRRRVFILAYHKSTELGKAAESANPGAWMAVDGVIAKAFPVTLPSRPEIFHKEEINGNSHEITVNFNTGYSRDRSPFLNAGIMIGRTAYTKQLVPKTLTEDERETIALRNYLDQTADINDFLVDEEIVLDKEKGWAFHKGPKTKKRKDPVSGYEYMWSEGGMSLTDNLDKPARTIITSEGGNSPSRSKHLIQLEDGRYRRLMPIELERVSMFPDDHTKYALHSEIGKYEVTGPSRAFFIGNALVAGVVERLGKALAERIEEEIDEVLVSHAR